MGLGKRVSPLYFLFWKCLRGIKMVYCTKEFAPEGGDSDTTGFVFSTSQHFPKIKSGEVVNRIIVYIKSVCIESHVYCTKEFAPFALLKGAIQIQPTSQPFPKIKSGEVWRRMKILKILGSRFLNAAK